MTPTRSSGTDVVTTSGKRGGLTSDGRGQYVQVSAISWLMGDPKNHAMSDWGSCEAPATRQPTWGPTGCRRSVQWTHAGVFGQFDRTSCTLCAPVHVIRLDRRPLSSCRSCPLVKWGGGTQVQQRLCVREPAKLVSGWRPWPGAVRRPFGALREAAGERIPGRPRHRRRPLWWEERRCAPRCLIAGSTCGWGFQFPLSAIRANAAAAGLTIFRRARVTGWSVTLIRTS